MHLAHVGAPGAVEATAFDDEAAAARARVDLDAFAGLYVRHRQAVLGYLRARAATEDDALELTAVTFERALLAIDRYRTHGSGFRAWLFRIARNAAVDEGRRRGRVATEVDSSVVDPGFGPDEAAIRADDARRLRQAMAALPEAQRDALGLRFGAGLTAREIGEVIGKRDAAVQKLIERAIGRLREDLA